MDAAIAIARITEEDPFAGLPEPEELGQIEGDLKLAEADVAQVEASARIDAAKRAEATALAADPRITNSEGAGCETYTGCRVFANSRGFLGSYASTTASLSVTPVARRVGTNGARLLALDFAFVGWVGVAGRRRANGGGAGAAPVGRAEDRNLQGNGSV